MATARRHFDSFTEARNHLRSVLDAAREGLVTTVARDQERFVVINASDLRHDVAHLRPAKAVVAAEGGGWSAVLPGVPAHGDGDTFADAIDDLILALREYAEDWNARLYRAPNHRSNRAVVELVELSDDEQLRDWILDRTDGAATARRDLATA
ncbi:MAG: prevent-host-death protein [Jiangellaceae bacterium]